MAPFHKKICHEYIERTNVPLHIVLVLLTPFSVWPWFHSETLPRENKVTMYFTSRKLFLRFTKLLSQYRIQLQSTLITFTFQLQE